MLLNSETSRSFRLERGICVLYCTSYQILFVVGNLGCSSKIGLGFGCRIGRLYDPRQCWSRIRLVLNQTHT